MIDLALRQRFLSKLDTDSSPPCWLWTAALASSGYGAFWNGSRMVRAHRFAYELAYGPIPAGHVVLHKCDNRACCWHVHLQAGTHRDNVDDKIQKGRHPSGERSPTAKLTNEQADEIRRALGSHSAIAHRYGVSRSTVGLIKQGKRYRPPATTAIECEP
jgi:hypothetical protein